MLKQEQFTAIAEEISDHPFLVEAASGTLPIAKWERYCSARLEAGPGFVQFLENLGRQAREQGFEDVASAVEGNRQEELGIVHGEAHINRAHHEWRRWFRAGMERVLSERGVNLRKSPPDDFAEVHGYPLTFDALNSRGNIHESMGALAVLELGLGYEYERILQGIALAFPNKLTRKELTYLVSHAQHEGRHFQEVFAPLADICTTREEIERAMCGAQLAKQTKLSFLSGAYRDEPPNSTTTA